MRKYLDHDYFYIPLTSKEVKVTLKATVVNLNS